MSYGLPEATSDSPGISGRDWMVWGQAGSVGVHASRTEPNKGTGLWIGTQLPAPPAHPSWRQL